MNEEINPYRSPSMAEIPKDEPLRTVQFAGRYSFEEGLAIAVMVETIRPKFWRLLRRGFQFARCLLPLVFVPFIFNSLKRPYFVTHSDNLFFCVVMFSCIAFSVLGIAIEFRSQQNKWKQPFAPQDAESIGIFRLFSGNISEEGLVVEQDDFKTFRPWHTYTHYDHRDDVILFWLADHAEADATSRSQFESGEDWLRALRLAKHHLPKQPGGAIARG